MCTPEVLAEMILHIVQMKDRAVMTLVPTALQIQKKVKISSASFSSILKLK